MEISVVGNAESIFNKKNGEVIDSADQIIRFNGGVIVDPHSQGTKTTILAYSMYKEKIKEFGKVEHWVVHKFPEKQHLTNIIGAKPSNGLIVLERLKNKYSDCKVRLFGFDWKQTPTWYRNIPGVPEHHNYSKEKEYCIQLINNLQWELY